ncbi:MAG: DUF1015 family protein [Clostridiales Family XIII bacterium]|jgi:uncharacterized protein (DUF1015 family)|nr:DUF1015 family protein [Clostridiales Family XIII bacterium]
MAIFRPFAAVRPAADFAEKVAALPYDVMTSEEARVMVSDDPWSFLHVDRAEIDLPVGTDPYSDEVYARAKANLEGLCADGALIQDAEPSYYIYRLTWQGVSQAGLVGCASIDDYLNDLIKKHELTRAEKEEDRIRHVDILDANTGPIFLACKEEVGLGPLLDARMAVDEKLYDFTTDDGVRHEVWRVGDAGFLSASALTQASTALYIADGHHRCASAVRVGQRRREQHPGYTGDEEFNYFLAVVFPEEQLRILDYNRVVLDLNGLSKEAFLDAVARAAECRPYNADDGDGNAGGAAFCRPPIAPTQKHEFTMYLDGGWYRLTAGPGTRDDTDPVASLDVSILQENLLAPVLGIADPRTDRRIDFVGGIRGLGELERRVDEADAAGADHAVAFALYPTQMTDLIAVADAGRIMPPKSTWFEPKLRSGLFIHRL